MTFEEWLESSECPSMYDALDAARAAWDKATEIERARSNATTEEVIKLLNDAVKDLIQKFYRTREFACIPLELVKAEAATMIADAVLERAATIQPD